MPRAIPYAIITVTLCLVANSLLAKKVSEESLMEVERKVQSVVEQVLPATVGIGSEGGMAGGSGVIVSKDGLILTAAHVVAATGKDIVVYFPNGKQVKAKRLGADNDADAAMVQITEEGEYPFVKVGDSVSIQRDDWMIALGHAGGFQKDRTPPVRLGRKLGARRGFITTDCTLIGGDSGGPLFNIKGEVVGIHSNIGASLTSNNHVAIQQFHDGWERMKEGESWGRRFGGSQAPADPNRPILGVMELREDSKNKRVYVEALEGGPAATAGVETGDALIKVGDFLIENYQDIRQSMEKKEAGDEIELLIKRDDEEKTLTVKLISREEFGKAQRQQRRRDRDRERNGENERNGPASNEEIDKWLKEKIKVAKAKKEELDLDGREIRRMGGMRRVMERLSKLVTRKEISELMGAPNPRGDQREDAFLKEVMTTFTTVVDDASPSVFPVFDDDEQVAMATAIRRQGYLITKASELEEDEDDNEFTIRLGDDEKQLKIIREFPKYDLAIVKIDAEVPPVTWYDPPNDPALGSIVAAAGTDNTPLAVGVISVAERNLSGSDKGFLGVQLEYGIRIGKVVKDSPAQKAGLKAGDQLVSVNNEDMKDVGAFIEAIRNIKPGETIAIGYRRRKIEELQSAQVTLASRENLPAAPDGTGRYPTGGKLSGQRSGYPNALQTDLPIDPEDCGSPVVDLRGRVLGINVARAGRIKSFAIPGETIEALVKDIKFDD